MRSLKQHWTKLAAGLIFLVPSLLSAAPVDGVFTYRQPDGSALKVRVKGDEFFAEEMTLDGQRVIQDPVTRFWCYAKLSADGSELESTGLVASEHSPRAFSSLESIPSPFSIKTPRAYRQRIAQANRTRLGRDHHGRLLQQPNGASLPVPGSGMSSPVQPVASSTLGVKHGLTLLIRFPDRAEDVTLNRIQVDNFCNQTSTHYTEFGNNGSVAEYYAVVSGGKLTYTNSVADYYTARNPRSYYTDPNIGFGTRSAEVITEALDALEASGFDFHSVDGDGDGAIDAVNCFYAGPTVNTWSTGLWPHASSLNWQSAKTGVRTAGYQISNMDTYLQLGTFCHENGHMLCSFPDVYDYDGDSSGGAGAFDLMDLGCFGVNPCAPDGYLRYKAGWGSAEILGLGVNATKTLTAENGGLLQNQFLIYANPAYAQEYYVIENIYRNGHNANLQTGGIAVWHVDELGSHNNQNYTHQGAHNNYSIALIQADNQRHFERNYNVADPQDLFYSGNAASGYINEFSDSSDSGPYDNNAHWWSGTNSGLKLSGFSAQGNTMSFIVQTPVAPTTYTISVSTGAGGGIYPSGNVSVLQGDNATFTIQADTGYTINTVLVDGTNIGAVTSYTFSNVTAAHTLSATFNAPPVGPAGYAWCAPENGSFTLGWAGTIDVAYGANGSFNYLYSKTGTITFNNATFGDPIPGVMKAGFYRMSAPPQFVLTASAGAGGAISPSGSVKVTQGYPQTFTITANAGYIISAVIVDGASVGAVGSYSFYNVTAAHTISASFSAVAVGPAGYTWCAGENGSFTLPGTCDVAYGANGSFNYLYGKTGTISFTNTTFGDPIPGMVKAGFYRVSAVQFTLTASAGSGGTISPAGSVTVNQGSSQTFTFTPNAGYIVSAVTVDGAAVTAGASYTFTNVATNHTLGVTFTLIPVSSNLALGKPASASSIETSAFPADLAVDGNSGTRWSSAFADPSWIAVDLGAAMTVNRVVLNWEAAYGKTYQIQTSLDNTNWTTVFTQSSGSGGLETDSFPALTARYVRMYGTARGSQWGYSLFDFEVYGQ